MRLFGILLVMAAAAFAAPAQTNAPAKVRQLSLQDCIQQALQHNLDLQIDRYDPQIALYSLQGSYGGYDPNFAFSGQHDHNEAGTRLFEGFPIPGTQSDDDRFSSSLGGTLPWGMNYSLQGNVIDTSGVNFNRVSTNLFASGFENSSGSASLSLVQPLLKNFWIDTTRLNIMVSRNRLQYSEQTLRLQIMTIITQLEQAYYDLIYDRENVVVQEKAVELAMRLVAENKKKVEVGSLAPLDQQQAESQAATSQATLLGTRGTLANQEHTIKQLITADYSSWADVDIEPTGTLGAPRQFFNLHDSWSKGLSLRPELVQARLDIERAGFQLKFDKNQLFPELDLFGTYGFNGSGGEYKDVFYNVQNRDLPFYTAGASISVPLSRTAARNTYRATKASLQQTLLRLKKTEQSIMVSIDNDIRSAQSSFEQVAATRAAREYAEAALNAEQKKLESGKSTTYTVLQVQRDLTNARGSEILALANYNKALSQLSLDEATTLDRLRVNLSIK